MERKFSSSLGVIAMIVGGILLGRLFESLTPVEAQGLLSVEGPACTVPLDFDWETYVQNYDDLRRAGITTEAKAIQHWIEYGRSEGRSYHEIRSRTSGSVAKAEARRTEAPLVTISNIPQTLLDPPLKIDQARVRERYDRLQQQMGVKTKEEAMDLGLEYWERKRKEYLL